MGSQENVRPFKFREERQRGSVGEFPVANSESARLGQLAAYTQVMIISDTTTSLALISANNTWLQPEVTCPSSSEVM